MFPQLLLLFALIYNPAYKNGDVGVQIVLPADSVVAATSQIPPSCMISSSNPSVMWHLRLDRSPNPSNLTPKVIVHQTRSRRDDPEGTKVLVDSALKIGDIDGWWLLLEESSGVYGWLAMPAIGNQTLVASVLTNKEGWNLCGDRLVRSLQSIVLLDPIARIGEKIDGLDASTSVLAGLSKESLQPLIGFHEWRRIQTADDSGAADIGYMQVSISAGTMRDINDVKAEGEEPPYGIIVTVRSRILPNPETGVVVDGVGHYWMSWDGKDERWSNRITRWLDRVSAVKSETGIRSRAKLGMAKPSLLVMQQDLTSNAIETPFQVTTEEPWMPRALSWILGPLLKDNHSSRFLWHMYDNSTKPRITTCRDIISSNADGTKTITSDFGSNGNAVSTTVDHNGFLVRQIQQGNILITGSTKETLQQIWQPQNLW